MLESKVSTFSPVHDTEERCVNVAGSISRVIGVDDFDASFIVFIVIDDGWFGHSKI